MKKIYFAAPMFNDAEKAFNEHVTNIIESTGKYDVFLPQRDGIKVEENKNGGRSLSETIFILDRDKLVECDVLLFICDGRCPDDGACVELGMAYMYKQYVDQNRLIIGLDTEARGMFEHMKLNPLVEHCFDYLFTSVSDLNDFLKQEK